MVRKEVAALTIRGANTFTPTGVAAVAAWLRNHAEMLELHHKQYDSEFKGAYEAYTYGDDGDGLDGELVDP